VKGLAEILPCKLRFSPVNIPQTTHKSHCCIELRCLDGVGRFFVTRCPRLSLVAPVGRANEGVVANVGRMHGKLNPVWYKNTDIWDRTAALLVRPEYLAILTRHDLHAALPRLCLIALRNRNRTQSFDRETWGNETTWASERFLPKGCLAIRTWKSNNNKSYTIAQIIVKF
jgi:hypothetical protein